MAEDGSEWVQSQVAHGVNDMVPPPPPRPFLSKLTPQTQVLLPTPSEDSISENLDKRLKKGIIYTYIGNVLVSVNPFEQLPLYVRASVLRCYSVTICTCMAESGCSDIAAR
jgi:myosin heavy subunit